MKNDQDGHQGTRQFETLRPGNGLRGQTMRAARGTRRAPAPTATRAPEAGNAAGGCHGPHGAHPAHGAHGASERPSSGARPKAGRGTRRALRAAGVAAAVLGALYLGGVAVFANVFAPGTSVNGQSVALKSTQALSSEVDSSVSNYSMQVTGDGLSLSVKASDIDLTVDADSYAASARAQSNAWAWPLTALMGEDVRVEGGIGYDEGKLGTLVDDAVTQANASATQPTDARLDYDPSAKSFSVTPETYGTALDAEATKRAIVAALSTGQPSLELGKEEILKPAVTKDSAQLAAAARQANAYLTAAQTLTANGSVAATVSADQIAQWVSVGDDLSVSLDTAAMTDWAQGELSKQLDTVGTTRSYTRPDGKSCTVSGGTYGWNVDGAALAQTIAANIQAGTAATVEVPWKATAASWNPGGAEWARYIDVDLTEQHVRFYDASGSVIWESDCVTGDVTEDRGTPEGVYSINGNMGTNQTLIGLDENHDGEPDYKSKVSYWMPFVDNMVAFHDAPWRGTFGGTIYRGNGSHGCINMPSANAQALYGLVQVGDVVVVHS